VVGKGFDVNVHLFRHQVAENNGRWAKPKRHLMPPSPHRGEGIFGIHQVLGVFLSAESAVYIGPRQRPVMFGKSRSYCVSS